MITPTKKAERISTQFVVTDIENRSDGSVITIDTFDGENHGIDYNWGSWLERISILAAKDKRYRTIYAHNGGGWDWLSFLEWCIKENPEQTFSTIENGNKIIAITIPINRKFSIKLTDSLYLLHSSLEKAAKKYLPESEGKLDIGDKLPEWYWENDRETYWRYAFRDTESLYKILCKFAGMVYEKLAPIGKLGLTLPSTSMRVFTTGYLDREVTIPTNDKLKKFLRAGYTGGRVEVFKSGYYPKVNVYDFNSLYPSVMASTNVPLSGTGNWTQNLHLDKCGIYHVRFCQRDKSKLPLLLKGGVGVYEGQGVYFTPELRRLVQAAKGAVEVIEGFVFNDQGKLFKSFVDTLYGIRLINKEWDEKKKEFVDNALGATCKLLLNSLYGKLAQQPERTKTCHLSVDAVTALINAGVEVETINEEYGIYRVTESRSVNFEHVGIAGIITSESRARLWECTNNGTVYVDTDSIHSISPTHDFRIDPVELGSMKHEFSGEAVYVGKKLYALRKNEHEKIRAKGIRTGGRNGFSLRFDDLRLLLDESKSLECKFNGATTANATFKGKKSCVFTERTRTIRKTCHV